MVSELGGGRRLSDIEVIMDVAVPLARVILDAPLFLSMVVLIFLF